MPLLTNIKSIAQGIVCIYNLKQIGDLTFSYSQDNKGFLPGYNALDYVGKGRANYEEGEKSWAWIYDKNTRTLTMYWTGHLAPYVFRAKDRNWNKKLEFAGYWKDGKKVYTEESVEEVKAYRDGYNNLKVFICPTSEKTDGIDYIINWGSTRVHKKDRLNRGVNDGQHIACSYVAMGEFYGQTWTGNTISKTFSIKKLTDFKSPGERILLLEGDTGLNQRGENYTPYVGGYFLFNIANKDWNKDTPNFFHDDDGILSEGRMNVLWADIHVSSIERNWIMDDPELHSSYWKYNWKKVRTTGLMDDTYKWSK